MILHDSDRVEYLRRNRSNALLEPAFTFRAGFKQAMFQLQYGVSYNLTIPDFDQYRYIASLGLVFTFR